MGPAKSRRLQTVLPKVHRESVGVAANGLAIPEARLMELMLRETQTLVWARDAQQRLIYLNGDVEDMLAMPPRQLLDCSGDWETLVYGPDRPSYQAARRELALRGESCVRYRVTIGDQAIWMEERGFALLDADTPMRYAGYLREVTADQEKEQENLSLSEHLWTMGQINQAVMDSDSAEVLFERICAILTQCGRFLAAWVFYRDQGEAFALTAHSELPDSLLRLLESWSRPSAAGRAMPLVMRQVMEMADFVPSAVSCDGAEGLWLKPHFPDAHQLIVFPLRGSGRLVATLTLVSHADQSFGYGEMDLLNGMVTDVSHALDIYHRERRRHRVEERLRLSAKVFESSREGILITDAQHRILSVNRAFTEITGFSSNDVLSKPPRVLTGGLGPGFFEKMRHALETTGSWQGEVWNRRKSGEVYPELLNITAVRDQNGRVTNYIGIVSDISERHAQRSRLEFLAHHDALTGLPNRVLLRERVEWAIAHGRRSGKAVALIFLDLDHFKSINDSLGHHAGDQLLLALVERLKGCLREVDTLSRLGGDEFVAVIPDLNHAEDAAVVAEKILAAVDAPILIEGVNVAAAFSMGISVFPEHGEAFDALLKNADLAMYQAKHRGRKTFCFYDDSLGAGSIKRLTLQGRLHGAAERGELYLAYQPQVDLASGCISGAEALLRWNSPDLGSVSPAEFIPVAEESGQIVEIGAWVLDQACRQCQAWRQAGLAEFTVAVNVSGIQFGRGDLVATIAMLLDRYQLPAHCLELEITESTMLRDNHSVLRAVQALKEMGVRLSIDDFGTGYSNLGYLRQFNADMLKIDQSFVRAMQEDKDSVSLVRTIVQMATNLNMETIAEGVETDRQLAILRNLGCRYVQGYFISRPIPADDFSLLLATSRNYLEIAGRGNSAGA